MGDDKPSGEGSKISKAVLADYIAVMKRILEENAVDYLDLYHFLPIPTKGEGNGYFADFVHPNDEGLKLIAQKIVEFLQKQKQIYDIAQLELDFRFWEG
jgi:lysophospholipase L1-like esterase